FLTFEEQSDRRHEYIQGRVYAMAGADEPHNTIVGNIFALLRAAVRGSTCRVYQTDMALRFDDEFYVYPDVMLTCPSRDAALEQFKGWGPRSERAGRRQPCGIGFRRDLPRDDVQRELSDK